LHALDGRQLQLIRIDVGIYLHCEEVLNPSHGGWFLGELLIEAIAEVVSRIRRYDEHPLSRLGKQGRQRARGGGLTDTALPAHEDPFQLLVLDEVPQSWVE
jgi:hypothetical protein